jgi:hypothetical protein
VGIVFDEQKVVGVAEIQEFPDRLWLSEVVRHAKGACADRHPVRQQIPPWSQLLIKRKIRRLDAKSGQWFQDHVTDVIRHQDFVTGVQAECLQAIKQGSAPEGKAVRRTSVDRLAGMAAGEMVKDEMILEMQHSQLQVVVMTKYCDVLNTVCPLYRFVRTNPAGWYDIHEKCKISETNTQDAPVF